MKALIRVKDFLIYYFLFTIYYLLVTILYWRFNLRSTIYNFLFILVRVWLGKSILELRLWPRSASLRAGSIRALRWFKKLA